MQRKLEGKVAVVTGGGNGIGAAIARRFAGEGAAVVVADLEEEGAIKVVHEITKCGGRAVACQVNIRDPDLIEKMFTLTRETFGPVELLINNAGLGMHCAFLETPIENLLKMLDVNVIGTFLCAQAGAREMIMLKRGRIVNFASHSAFLGSTGRTAYAASKGGVVAMTRAMAIELASHNVTVNAIAPGPINVPRQRLKHTQERRQAWQKAVPLGRYGEPDEVARVALFLASDDASYVNGQTISVDGGFTAAGLRVSQPNAS